MTDEPQRHAPPGTPRASRSAGGAPAAPDPWEPVVEAVAGGRICWSQDIVGKALRQSVDLRRPDGSVWRAYERLVVLPDNAGMLEPVLRQATTILALAARAVAAADTARIARSSGLFADTAALRGRYGAGPRQG